MKKIILIGILLSPIAHGMQQASEQLKNERIFSRPEIAINICALQFLDHQTICSLASAFKYINQSMIATAKNRSKHLNQCSSYHPLSQLLHKYGSARCYAIKWPEVPELTLGYHELKDGKNMTKYHRFNGFISPLWSGQQPFFNEDGDMCFYGYGNYTSYNDFQLPIFGFEGIFRYCINASRGLCGLQAVEGDTTKLLSFMRYPSLLKALLRSQEMLISFDDIIIPDDYKNTVAPIIEKDPDISDYIKNLLKKRYEEQVLAKCKKNN